MGETEITDELVAQDPTEAKKGWKGWLITIIALTMVIYHFFAAGTTPLPSIMHRSLHIGLGFSLIWLVRPWFRGSVSNRTKKVLTAIDVIMVIGMLLCTAYVFLSFKTYNDRVGLPPTTMDLILGGFLILASIEAARRTTGYVFPAITGLFVIYGLFGQYFPEPFSHAGISLPRFISAFYLTLEGPYGFITGVSADYIFLFIVFAGIIRNTAVGKFIIDISMSLVGVVRGGPAKMAVIASSLMGMVTGSSLANVAGVGSFTIPLMKSIGYRPEFAAGVEASSGMGAQIMPPVMGGSVFVMMEILAIPYWTICVAAFPIAILFYIGLFFATDSEAVRLKLVGLSKQELPSFWTTLKKGWYLVLPVVVLIGILVQGFTPSLAGFWAIIAAVITGFIPRVLRLNFRKLLHIMEEAAIDSVVVIGLVAAASLIQGIVSVTGIGLQLSNILIDLAHGNLLVLLVITAITSIILGMGLPVLVCYTLLALLVAPALIKLGIAPLAAHMFVFYYGILSMITPPVAPDCFVAAGIAKCDPLKTAVNALRIGLPIFFIPFFFVYNPIFLLHVDSPIGSTLWVFFTAILGVYALAAGLQGIILYKTFLNVPQRCALIIAGLLLLSPTNLPSLAGMFILVAIQGWTYFKEKKQSEVKV